MGERLRPATDGMGWPVSRTNWRARNAQAGRTRDAVVASERGPLAAARAEHQRTRGPLVVESMSEKLARLVPGAKSAKSDAGWSVTRDGRVLALGASEREAVDRCLFLWGQR